MFRAHSHIRARIKLIYTQPSSIFAAFPCITIGNNVVVKTYKTIKRLNTADLNKNQKILSLIRYLYIFIKMRKSCP
jgi:hypothetical protein